MHIPRLKFKPLRRLGFTLIENTIILVLVGVLSAIAAPSFTDMLAGIELNKSVAEVQTSFSAAQRQAIRNQTGCEVGILDNKDPNNDDKSVTPSVVYGECLPTKDALLSKQTIVATNILPLTQASTQPGELVAPDSSSWLIQEAYKWCVKHESHGHDYWDKYCKGFQQQSSAVKFASMIYRPDGAASFNIQTQAQFPSDPSGKMVFYREGKSRKKPKCMVISRRLGLIRKGFYSGSMAPTEMTESGICETESWDKQTT